VEEESRSIELPFPLLMGIFLLILASRVVRHPLTRQIDRWHLSKLMQPLPVTSQDSYSALGHRYHEHDPSQAAPYLSALHHVRNQRMSSSAFRRDSVIKEAVSQSGLPDFIQGNDGMAGRKAKAMATSLPQSGVDWQGIPSGEGLERFLQLLETEGGTIGHHEAQAIASAAFRLSTGDARGGFAAALGSQI
jgi:hypothetical protein